MHPAIAGVICTHETCSCDVRMAKKWMAHLPSNKAPKQPSMTLLGQQAPQLPAGRPAHRHGDRIRTLSPLLQLQVWRWSVERRSTLLSADVRTYTQQRHSLNQHSSASREAQRKFATIHQRSSDTASSSKHISHGIISFLLHSLCCYLLIVDIINSR